MTRPPFDPDAPDQFPDAGKPLTALTPAARHRQGPPPPPAPPVGRRRSARDEFLDALTMIVPAVFFTALGFVCGVVFSR